MTRIGTEITNSGLHFNDKSAAPIPYIRKVARRWKKEHDICLLVIDYLQLVRPLKTYKGDNRQSEVAEISAGVKALAKELDIPILIAAQLNRDVEKRTGNSRGKPRLADLRESGAIEQDADVVALLSRPEVYADDDEQKAELQGLAELEIAKQRSGPIGTVRLTFLKEFTRFTDRARIESI